LLGYQNQALARIREALVLAEKRGHPYSLAYALNSAVILHQLRREVDVAQGRAEEAIQLATNQEFPFWKIMSKILRGWGIVMQGQYAEGIFLMQKGIASWQAAGSEISLSYFLVLLAEAYKKSGETRKGLEVLTTAYDLALRTGDRWWEAELYRLKGEILLLQCESQRLGFKGTGAKLGVQESKSKRGKPQSKNCNLQLEAEVETCFHQALNLARRQRAKSLELRAVVSLCQLWRQQGKEADALQLLTPVYGWFQEGFDTLDLQDAWALLQSLYGNSSSKLPKP
jgi:predicted ATPase